jgi:CBS domain-containing protein
MLETSTHPEITVSGIRVRDVMQREVATIAEMASVRDLAELLQQHEISGAPVLAEDGTVLGVASLWDIVRLASREQQRTELVWPEAGEPFGEGGFYGTPVHARPSGHAQWRTIVLPLLERYRVRDIMTRAIFHVREDATLQELARYLVASKIHRALVLERGKLLGIVTSSNIVEAVASGQLR